MTSTGDPSVAGSAVPAGARCAIFPDREAIFVCTRCGAFGCEQARFSALAGKETCIACAAKGLREPIPWEQRSTLGYVRAYWWTSKLLLKDPVRVFRTPRTEDGLIPPLVYGLAAFTAGQLIYALYMAVLMVIGGGISAAFMPDTSASGFLVGYFGCLGIAIVPMTLLQAPIQGLIGILFAAAMSHGTLMLTKSRKAPFEATLRAVSYANAPYLLYVVPCFGIFIAWFWTMYLEVVALREAHDIGTDRAVLAVVGYRALLILGFIGIYAGIIALTIAAAEANVPPP